MSYFWGYLIPACSLILARIIFLVGRQSYILRPPAGSELATTLSIVKEAVKKSWRPALSKLFVDHWLDRAKQCYGGCYSNWEVEDVKKVFRLLPIFGMFILYWTVYSQVSVIDIVLPSRKPSCHSSSFPSQLPSLPSQLPSVPILSLLSSFSFFSYPSILLSSSPLFSILILSLPSHLSSFPSFLLFHLPTASPIPRPYRPCFFPI